MGSARGGPWNRPSAKVPQHQNKFLYLGMMVETVYDNETIKEIIVDQVAYISGLEPIPLEKSNKTVLRMNEILHSEFRPLVGGLSWVVTQSKILST